MYGNTLSPQFNVFTTNSLKIMWGYVEWKLYTHTRDLTNSQLKGQKIGCNWKELLHSRRTFFVSETTSKKFISRAKTNFIKYFSI